MIYEKEIADVEAAVRALNEEDPVLVEILKEEQSAAATGLEFYGITKSVMERFVKERNLSNETLTRVSKAIPGVRRMFQS